MEEAQDLSQRNIEGGRWRSWRGIRAVRNGSINAAPNTDQKSPAKHNRLSLPPFIEGACSSVSVRPPSR